MMKHIVYLRSGKVVEVEADSVACVDRKNQTYKFYGSVDEYAINKHLVFVANNPDAIKIDINQNKNEDAN